MSAWLYTAWFLSLLALDSADTLRFPLAVSRWRTSRRCVVRISWRAYMCLPASVCASTRSYFSACDIWRFAPKANKSAMPGIRPWPLLKPHRQAERLINQTASHRCDGFHTNRQQTVKVTSNRVNCQPGRQAGRQAAPPPPLSPLLYFISQSPRTSSHLQSDASARYI